MIEMTKISNSINCDFVSPEYIRNRFSFQLSETYLSEVPFYGKLLDLVKNTNNQVIKNSSALKKYLTQTGELSRLNLEYHCSISLGTPEELFTIRRIFSVMGMYPIGYYDLAPNGMPLHSTAFRALDSIDLNNSPFRIITSLLRLDLIDDIQLKAKIQNALETRQIFNQQLLSLLDKNEKQGGLHTDDANQFVNLILEIFQWTDKSVINSELYQELLDQCPLIANMIAFRGLVNYLCPTVLDIDNIQDNMKSEQTALKSIIEGSPHRKCPILLRQTSFQVCNKTVKLISEDGVSYSKYRVTRFGEVEERGIALTHKGHKLYNRLLDKTHEQINNADEINESIYNQILENNFRVFPDSYIELYNEKLAYFKYFCTDKPITEDLDLCVKNLDNLIDKGYIEIEPMVYEDFLPINVTMILRCRLANKKLEPYPTSSQEEFEDYLGTKIINMLSWYDEMQNISIQDCFQKLKLNVKKNKEREKQLIT